MLAPFSATEVCPDVVAGGCTERPAGGALPAGGVTGVVGAGGCSEPAGVALPGVDPGAESSFFVAAGGSTRAGLDALSPAGGALSVVVTGATTGVCWDVGVAVGVAADEPEEPEEPEELSSAPLAGSVTGAATTAGVPDVPSFFTSTGALTTTIGVLSAWPLPLEPGAGCAGAAGAGAAGAWSTGAAAATVVSAAGGTAATSEDVEDAWWARTGFAAWWRRARVGTPPARLSVTPATEVAALAAWAAAAVRAGAAEEARVVCGPA